MTEQLDALDPAFGSVPGYLSLERQHETPLADDDVRRRIREDLDASLFVEAAAGAGKTTALVSRIVSLVGAGRGELQNMVAVTYTHRAAGEMKLRLRRDIEEARIASIDPEVSDRFVRAIRQLEVARIGTIHSVCADLLRERPLEAGVDPLFRMSADSEASRLLDQAFDSWFQEVLRDPPAGVRRVLGRRPRRLPGSAWRLEGPRQELQDAVRKLSEHRDFSSPWQRSAAFDYPATMDRVLELLHELSDFADLKPRYSNRHIGALLTDVRGRVKELEARGAGRSPAPESIETMTRELLWEGKKWDRRGHGKWFDEAKSRTLEEVKGRRDEIHEELVRLMEAAEADLAALLREELRPAVDAYEELKSREGVLDFVDLLLKTRNLIRDDALIRSDLQARFTHYFVDEFQDTDPLQAEILLLLTADDPEETDARRVTPASGKLFVVGDPKQSIYSFRRADVRIYEEIKGRLSRCGMHVVQLSTSFRSVPAIQGVVNASFSEAIQRAEDGSQPAYVSLEKFREGTEGQPAAIALPAPHIYSEKWGGRALYTISASYADAVGAFVRWLVEESGWKVTEPGRPDRLVDLRYRHVCILSRRLQSQYAEVMRPYVQAFESREVPHVLVGGKGFHDREEVLALRNALQAIEWPDDALSVYATLKGPFLSFTDSQILAFRHRYGSLHPLAVAGMDLEQREDPETSDPVDPSADDRDLADALSMLASLHRGRNRHPIAHTISQFLSAVRAHAGLANWRAGEQVLANCLRVVDRARAFEKDGGTSFRAFVELLEDEASRGEGEEAPIVEEGTEGVRIMSVHKAKGLEFPVVILADPTNRLTFSNPSRYVDPERRLWAEPLCGAVPQDVLDHQEDEAAHDRAEAVRVTYVAATRARDLLVLPAVGEGDELTGWAESLNPAIYPRSGARRSPALEGEQLPGCPPLGDQSVLAAQRRADPPPGGPDDIAVKPGLHRSRAGTEVVWWDPSVFELDVAPATGLREQEILAADEDELVSTAGVQAYEEWRETRRTTTEAGARPEATLVTVRAMAARRTQGPDLSAPDGNGRPPEAADGRSREATAPEVRHLPRPDGGRPSGARFGELVHRSLAAVDLTAPPNDIRNVVDLQARLLGAQPEESAAARIAVEHVLADPLLIRAASHGDGVTAYREVPVFLREENGEIVEGVVDLTFRESGSTEGGAHWTVVEFKTDYEVEGALPLYMEQVAIYVRAIEKAVGEEARGVLLVI
ncbi:MAG: AAA family ATPase [Gemmatimonas sp.]|nr:AAA family ATPase [Gemmatimonas sp.]